MEKRSLTTDIIRQAQAAGKRVELWDAAQRGLFALVTPKGAATFYVFYRTKPDGRKRKYRLGRVGDLTITEARDEAGDVLTAVRKGRDPVRDGLEDEPTETEETEEKGESVDALVAKWLRNAAVERREKTMEAYRGAANRFLVWAKSDDEVEMAADLNRAKLKAFRAYLVALPRHSSAKGGKRGKKTATEEKRSAASINRELRSVKTMLNDLRQGDSLPGIDRDAIADCLQLVEADRVSPSRLKTAQIKRLLEACDRHDAATFKTTRDGRTDEAKHVPVKPLVVFMLLTGMRLNEALTLTWDRVDLDTTDHDGQPLGEIELHAGNVKTRRDRTVYLDVCPTIRKMLAAMKLASGGRGLVWADHTEQTLSGARKRLAAEYGAPVFLWSTQHSKGDERSPPTLRATCATYLHSSNIYGPQGLHLGCAQLGHSPEVARVCYAGVERSIDRDARTLEAAMRIEELVGDIALAPRNRRASKPQNKW